MNYSKILSEIGNVSLVVVTKQVGIELIKEVYSAGCRDFGESRVNAALEKMEKLPIDCRWHFIGRLQKNKVSKVVGRFALIHSVDSFELAMKISEESLKKGSVQPILLQANTSGEKTKAGLTPDEWKRIFPSVVELQGIEVKGFMTMAPFTEDEERIRICFRVLKKLRDELAPDLPYLSMGMSHDYKIAMEEGATLLRLGSCIFNYNLPSCPHDGSPTSEQM